MKNFLSYLTEIFDRPFSFRAIKGDYGQKGSNMFSFSPSSDETIHVFIDLYANSLNLSFTSNKSMEMTGKGNPERILATVMRILEKFLEASTPDEIVFVAPSDSPARARVYEKMVGRYAKSFQYNLVRKEKKLIGGGYPDEIWFTLSHEGNVF